LLNQRNFFTYIRYSCIEKYPMLKKILIITPLILLFIVLLIVVLHWRTRVISDSIQKILGSSISGVEITYDEISGDLFQNVTITDFKLALENGTRFRTNKVNIRYSLFSTISEEYHFDSILFDSLQVILAEGEKDTSAGKPFNLILEEASRPEWYRDIVKNLPDLRFGSLKINHGRITNQTNTFLVNDIDLSLTGFTMPGGMDVEVEGASGVWVDKNLDISNLSFRLEGNEKRTTVNRLNLKTSNSLIRAALDAEISDSFQVILGLSESRLSADDLNRLFNLAWLDSGEVDFDGQIIGLPKSFNADLKLSGKINRYKVDHFTLQGAYENDQIKLKRVELRNNESRLVLNGEIFSEPNTLRLKFSHLDLAYFLPDLPLSDLNGILRADLSGFEMKTAEGGAELQLNRSSVDSIMLEDLNLRVNLKNGLVTIEDSSYIAFTDSSRFFVRGTIDQNYDADLSVGTENNDIQALAGVFDIAGVEGMLDGNIFITGNLADPNIEGYLWFPHGRYQALEVDSLIFQTKIDRILTTRRGDAFLTITRGKIEDFEFTETHAEILFDGDRIFLDSLLFAQERNYFSTAGQLSFAADTINISLNNFRLFYSDYWIKNNGEIRIRIDPDELNVEQALFMAPDSGVLEVRGYWDRIYQEVQTGLLVRNMQIGPLRQFLGPGVNLQGMIEGDIELIDPMTNPELDIDLRGWQLQYNDAPFGDVSCTFKYLDGKFYFEEFKMVYDSTTVELDGDITIEFGDSKGEKGLTLLEKSTADVNLTWNNIDLRKYRSVLGVPRLSGGMVSGRLALLGTLNDPVGSIILRGNDIGYEKFHADSVVSYFRFTRDTLMLENMSLILNDTDIEADGWLGTKLDFTQPDSNYADRPFELNIHSEDDTLAFIGFLTDQVERLRGPFIMDITLAGTLSDPVLKSGKLSVDNGVLELTRVMNPITNVNIEATINDGRMEIERFEGYAARDKDFWDQLFSIPGRIIELFGGQTTPEGVVSGEGTITFDRITHPYIDLTFDMNRLYINYFVENTQLLVSSDALHVTGRDTIKVSGDLDIGGKFVVDLQTLKRNIYLSGTEIKGQERNLTWDLKINIPGNFIITSSAFDLANNFQLDIIGEIHSVKAASDRNMGLTGFLNTNSGRYRSWGQNFEVKSGNILFNDPNVINPDIEILAEKISREMTFELTIRGNLERQQVDLQVKDENDQYLNYTNSDKITLLSLGTTADQLSAADLTTAGEDVIKTSVETAFSHGAETLTGLDKVEVDMSGSLVDLQTMKLNNGLKDASLLLGKYVFSNLYLEYRSQFGSGTIPAPKLSWEPGNQIGLKYRINKSWSIDSNYSLTQRGNNLIQISLSWKKTF